MTPISIPNGITRHWITGVPNEAFGFAIIGVLDSARHPVVLVLFEDFREAAQARADTDVILQMPDLKKRKSAIRTTELPCLSDYSELESLKQEKRCDLIRALGLIREASQGNEPVLVFTTIDALFQELPAAAEWNQTVLHLKKGATLSFDSIRETLANKLHYSYEAVCEAPGEFAVRGGIIDVYPPNALAPVRIDCFGDEIESLRTYDPTTQLTDAAIDSLTLLPAEWEHDNATRSAGHGLFSHLDGPVQFILRESRVLESRVNQRFSLPEERNMAANHASLEWAWTKRDGSSDQWVAIDEHPDPSHFLACDQPDRSMKAARLDTRISGELEKGSGQSHTAEEKVLAWLADHYRSGYRVIIAVTREDERERLAKQVADKGYGAFQPEWVILEIARGLVFEGGRKAWIPEWIQQKKKSTSGVIVCGESDLHPHIRIRPGTRERRRLSQHSQVDALLDFTELVEGDHLVHQTHGICRYVGIQTVTEPTLQEAIVVEFSDNARLSLPLSQSHLLSRYVGLTKRPPKLGKIGSNQWEKDRKAAELATLDLASQLLALQARREAVEGFQFPQDDAWQERFEATFPFKETPDQLTAIRQTKADMELARPMDRLICGDVGFGKTEVALRAAFKALNVGKQVAVLVPTTVLCQQHFNTFKDRLDGFPVVTDQISGFRTSSEQDRILTQVANGQVDLIVGTHRLLSADVRFHDLGLIIVDEEHRFGVRQKERLKQISEKVDVLTLSATPIPRTLYLALAGARDLSVIETAPVNRLPIETIVRSYDAKVVDAAIRAEVQRGGQVFYLHNRVASIHHVAARINERNPGLRVAVGHGQMHANDLEDIMTDFVNGAYDVLVCTTIIESGLDIPNCNTLIIEGADRFGLAQLYQIRGRVGRFNRQAYAYLLLHDPAGVASSARKRLSAIRQYNELGSGYRIAMRDLELRGAGNILGAEQSGHIAGVGFDLYCRLLKQSINRLQNGIGFEVVRAVVKLDFALMGEPSGDATPSASGNASDERSRFAVLQDEEEGGNGPWVDPVYAYLPREFIPETSLRVECYRRLSSCATVDEIKSIRAEFKDRFGKLPDAVEALIRITAIRCLAEAKGIASVEAIRGKLKCRLAHKKDLQYIQSGSRFPRLTRKPPLLLLNDTLNFLSNL